MCGASSSRPRRSTGRPSRSSSARTSSSCSKGTRRLPKLYYASPRDLPAFAAWPGAQGRVLQTDGATMIQFDLDPKVVVETHKHDVEQFGVVVKGSLAMVIAGEQRILTPGDTYRIPPGTAHGARVFEEPTRVIDVYVPARSDIAGAPAERG